MQDKKNSKANVTKIANYTTYLALKIMNATYCKKATEIFII